MDRQRVDAWLDGYRRPWEQADSPAVLGLFTTDASYRSHPLRPAHTGHDGVAARDYWFLEPGTHQPFEGWGR
jgi:hypothetical protein